MHTRFSNHDRQATLSALLNFQRPLSTVMARLAQFGFDNTDEPLTLEPSHLRHALTLFLDNRISASDLEEWANQIETRDDLRVYDTDDEIIASIICDLASPTLQGIITDKNFRTAFDQLNR